MTEEEIKLYNKVLNKYGIEPQCLVAMEELAELAKEVSKCARRVGNIENLTEEIADVYIMIDQMKNAFDVKDSAIESWRNFKLDRLNKRINGE